MKMYSLAISVPRLRSLEQEISLDRILSDRRTVSYFMTPDGTDECGAVVENYLIRFCLEE
jgi:hypothetical protein